MRKEKPGDTYLQFLLETAAREPVNEAGFLDNILSKFGNTDMGQRARGRLDTRELARQLKREWMRYAGQQHGSPAGVATPRNIQRWLKQRYGVDVEVVPENQPSPQQASPQQRPQAKPQAQQEAEPEQEPAEPEQPQATAPEPSGDTMTATASETSADEVNEKDDITSLKQAVMQRLKNPIAKIFDPGSRSPEQYANYLRMGLQAVGANDPRTGKPPFGEPLGSAVGRAMAKVTTALASAQNEQTVTSLIGDLKNASETSNSPNDKKAVEDYLNDVFSDPEFARAHPYLRDMKKQNDEDAKFAQSPLGQVAPDRLFNNVTVKAVQFKEMKGNPSPQDQEQFTAMVSALCQRALQQPDAFKQKVDALVDGMSSDPTLLKRFPALQQIIAKFKGIQSESLALGYVSFLFESYGFASLLCEDDLDTEEPETQAPEPMDLDGRLTGNLVDRFFVLLAQQLLATGAAHRNDQPAPPRSAPQQSAKPSQPRPAHNFEDILNAEARKTGATFSANVRNRVINLVNEKNWRDLDKLMATLTAEQTRAITMATARAFR